jgi:hypothetical protein
MINLQEGQDGAQATLFKVPAHKRLVIECIGVNAFHQPRQSFVIALEVTAHGHTGLYPIVLTGSSTIEDPEFPARSFGSQLVHLYAASDTEVLLPIKRNNAQGAARAEVHIAGVLVDVGQ